MTTPVRRRTLTVATPVRRRTLTVTTPVVLYRGDIDLLAPGRAPQTTIMSRLRLIALVSLSLVAVAGATTATPAAATGAAAATAQAAATASATQRWVTAWESPPSGAVAPNYGVNAPAGFDDQTFRLMLSSHAAGTEVRVVLSNQFEDQPLTVSAATIAAQASGAAVVPSSMTPLTFNGSTSVTIPAGGRVLSDPTTFKVAAFENLAVSLAFDGSTGSVVGHKDGLQTSYLSPIGSGDLSASPGSQNFTGTTLFRFVATGLQVLASAPARTIVAVGDSITDGAPLDTAMIDHNERWPDYLQRRLLAAGSLLSVANAGIAGNQVTNDEYSQDRGPSLVSRFRLDVLDQPNLAGVILLEGINDIGYSGVSASSLIDGYRQVAAMAHAAGVPIVIATMTPAGNSGYGNGWTLQTRDQVNRWILGQHLFDGVLNFSQAVADPSDPEQLLAAYNAGDSLHPNAAGNAAIANSINLRNLRVTFGDIPGATRVTSSWRLRGACRARTLVLKLAATGVDRITTLRVALDGTLRALRALYAPAATVTLGHLPTKRFTIRLSVTATSSGGSQESKTFAACGRHLAPRSARNASSPLTLSSRPPSTPPGR